MPRIPTYQRQQLVQGDMQIARADTNRSGASPIGEALQNIGGMIDRQTMDYMAEQKKQAENLAAVDTANVLSQADVHWQQRTTEATKAWTVGGPDLRETLGKEFDAWQAETSGKLSSDKARNYFNQHAAGMKSRLQTGVYSYQERATTAKLNADSSAGEQADENVVFGDPARFDEVFRRRTETMLARSDLSEADKITAATKYKVKLSMAVERGQLERDPVAWYRERFGEFGGKNAAPAAPGAPASAASGDVPPSLWAAQIRQESGGRQFGKDGKPLTSSAGAIGVAQVMPGTAPEAAKLAGLPFDERRYREDAGYNESLGRAYMAKQMQTFGGDQSKALAAYNAGPARVSSLIAKHGDNWLQHAPAETKNYVKTILAKSGTGGSVQATAPAGPVADAPKQAAVVPPSSFSNMDYEAQLQFKGRAETLLKQAEAQFRGEADRAVRDAIAMHKDGVVDPVELQPEFFSRAYGAEGSRLHSEYVQSRDMGADISGYKTQSEAEILADLQQATPTPGPGYESADQRRGVRVQAAQRVLQARNEDPAGYVVKTSESLTKQREALDDPQMPAEQRPAMVQQFVRDSLAEQQRLGIRAPRILTPGQADAIAGRAMGAQRPEDSANLIAGLEAEYGGYFSKVFAELARDKKISGELLLIPNLPSQAAREAVSRLARVKETDLTAGLDPDAQRVVKEAVLTKLEGYAKAVPMMTEQAAGTINSYESSMRKIAFSLVAGGMKPADAAEQANTMLLGHYQFDGTMRVPNSVNLRETKRGADFMLTNDMTSIDVPRDLVGARKPDELAAEWQNTVKSRPMWFTADDDSGLTLYAQGSNGVRYRVTRGGKPVTYSWPDLSGRVATSKGRVSSGSISDLTGGK